MSPDLSVVGKKVKGVVSPGMIQWMTYPQIQGERTT